MPKKEIKNSKDKTSFMKSFKAEIKKVIWPTPKQLFNNTVAVLVIVIITAIIVFAIDLTFESINEYGIDKIKQQVSNSSSKDETITNNAKENNIETDQNNAENSQETNNVIVDESNNTVE